MRDSYCSKDLVTSTFQYFCPTQENKTLSTLFQMFSTNYVFQYPEKVIIIGQQRAIYSILDLIHLRVTIKLYFSKSWANPYQSSSYPPK